MTSKMANHVLHGGLDTTQGVGEALNRHTLLADLRPFEGDGKLVRDCDLRCVGIRFG